MMKHKVLFLLTLLCLTVAAAQAQIQVKGNVVSKSDQEPVIGASVVVMQGGKASATGTVTDLDGNFTLSAPKGAQLRVSYIGYKDVLVAAAAELKIQLEDDSQMMDEVVVTGYASEKKADLTGSVSVVKMKDVADVPTGNVLQALQGRVPGMSISTDGTPGGLSTGVQVRGTSSFQCGTGPLYVIDGVMTRDGLGTILNSADVESIQVLKDAASASIYGAQAANGVIVVTTKRAKKGETRITFDASLTAQTYNKGLDLLNADEWGEVYWSAFKYANGGQHPNSAIYGNGDKPALQGYTNVNGEQVVPGSTDWLDAIHRTSFKQQYNIGVQRGSENGATSFSLSWLGDKGVVKGTDFQKATARLASDYGYLNNRLKVGANISLNYWTDHPAPGGIEENVVKQHPAKTIYDAAGVYNDAITDVLGDTPNAIRLINGAKGNKYENWRVFGNTYLSVEPVKNLIAKTNFGLNFLANSGKSFDPAWARESKNFLGQDQGNSVQWVWSNTLQYNFDLGAHSFMALTGIEAKREHNQGLHGEGKELLLEDEDFRYLNNVTTAKGLNSWASTYTMFSWFAKFSWNYAGRYLLSGTLRRDASSRLNPDDNADWFPSVSAGWRISDEKFMEGTRSWLSNLKLRASWGINGNDLIDNEAFYAKYRADLNSGYNFSGDNTTLLQGAWKDRSTNPDLRWEKTTQMNVGIDAALLDNRLVLSADWFYKKTKDMLVEKPYIAAIGEGGYCWYNGGEMRNTGIEAQINWRDHVKDFQYEIGFNISAMSNKVTDLLPDIYYTYGGGNGIDKSLVGHALGSWMGYRTDGVFRTQQEVDDYRAKYDVQHGAPGVGRIRYVDTNGDGKINDSDRTWIGTDRPKAELGLNLSASWKGFDFSAFFSGVIRDAFNNSRTYTDFFALWNGNHGRNLLTAARAYDEFLTTGVYNCDIPAPTTVNSNSEESATEYWIEDGSFVRLKTLTLGYSLPRRLIAKAHMTNVRLYVQAQNLLTITGYDGADPEGLGYPYALPRQFTFGLQLGF